MAGTVKKPEPAAPSSDERIEKLERELAALKDIMRRNGWSLPE